MVGGERGVDGVGLRGREIRVIGVWGLGCQKVYRPLFLFFLSKSRHKIFRNYNLITLENNKS